MITIVLSICAALFAPTAESLDFKIHRSNMANNAPYPHVNRGCPAVTTIPPLCVYIFSSVYFGFFSAFWNSCSCGQETRVIPRILQLRSHWLKSEKESLRLQEAGITKEVMNSAIAQFCLEIIAKHGEPAPRLCNKDPLTLKMGSYVIELFPNVSTRGDTISPSSRRILEQASTRGA